MIKNLNRAAITSHHNNKQNSDCNENEFVRYKVLGKQALGK